MISYKVKSAESPFFLDHSTLQLRDPFETTKAVHIEGRVFTSYMAAYIDQILRLPTGVVGSSAKTKKAGKKLRLAGVSSAYPE